MLTGPRIDRKPPFLGVVLARDLLAVRSPSGEQRIDFFVGEPPRRTNAQADCDGGMQVRADDGDRRIRLNGREGLPDISPVICRRDGVGPLFQKSVQAPLEVFLPKAFQVSRDRLRVG